MNLNMNYATCHLDVIKHCSKIQVVTDKQKTKGS